MSSWLFLCAINIHFLFNWKVLHHHVHKSLPGYAFSLVYFIFSHLLLPIYPSVQGVGVTGGLPSVTYSNQIM